MGDTLKKNAIEIRKFILFFFSQKICKNLAISFLTPFVGNVSGTSGGFTCKRRHVKNVI